MLKAFQGPVLGTITLFFFVLNTIFWCVPLFITAILKVMVPNPAWRRTCTVIITAIADAWVACNNLGLRLTRPIEWDVSGLENLERDGWYLVICNHQSWVDIPVLQKIFYHRIPFLKFFLKKELIWVPALGLAWWALDFPFMKRYPEAFLRKHPHLKGKDLEITRKACRKFKTMPVSIMNFVEGSRFTPQKHTSQESPFDHLLRPKAGGTGFVLSAMGEQLSQIVNVTIVYPDCPDKSLWAFLCGYVDHIIVQVETIPITADLLGDYTGDEDYRHHFQQWLNRLWAAKDHQIERITHQAPHFTDHAEE